MENESFLLLFSPAFLVRKCMAGITRTPTHHVLFSCARIVQQKPCKSFNAATNCILSCFPQTASITLCQTASLKIGATHPCRVTSPPVTASAEAKAKGDKNMNSCCFLTRKRNPQIKSKLSLLISFSCCEDCIWIRGTDIVV